MTAEEIIRLRKRLGLTQRELGERIGAKECAAKKPRLTSTNTSNFMNVIALSKMQV